LEAEGLWLGDAEGLTEGDTEAEGLWLGETLGETDGETGI